MLAFYFFVGLIGGIAILLIALIVSKEIASKEETILKIIYKHTKSKIKQILNYQEDSE